MADRLGVWTTLHKLRHYSAAALAAEAPGISTAVSARTAGAGLSAKDRRQGPCGCEREWDEQDDVRSG
jgi:hypothetical protein